MPNKKSDIFCVTVEQTEQQLIPRMKLWTISAIIWLQDHFYVELVERFVGSVELQRFKNVRKRQNH